MALERMMAVKVRSRIAVKEYSFSVETTRYPCSPGQDSLHWTKANDDFGTGFRITAAFWLYVPIPVTVPKVSGWALPVMTFWLCKGLKLAVRVRLAVTMNMYCALQETTVPSSETVTVQVVPAATTPPTAQVPPR